MNEVSLNNPEVRQLRSVPAAQVQAQDGKPAAAVQVDSTRAVASEAKRDGGEQSLSNAVYKLNDYVQKSSRDLQFEVNRDSGQTIVRVVDQQTQKVIRQIPDDVALRLAEKLQQDEPLSLFDVKI